MSERDRRFFNRVGWALWIVGGGALSWSLGLDFAHLVAFQFGLAMAVYALHLWWEVDQ